MKSLFYRIKNGQKAVENMDENTLGNSQGNSAMKEIVENIDRDTTQLTKAEEFFRGRFGFLVSILYFASAYLFTRGVYESYNQYGYWFMCSSVVILVVILGFCGIYLNKKRSMESYYWPLLMLLTIFSYKETINIGALMVLGVVLMGAYWSLYLGEGTARGKKINILYDMVNSLVILPITNFLSLFTPIGARNKQEGRTKGIILGLILAIPLLAVVIVLLKSSDDVFNEIFDPSRLIDLASLDQLIMIVCGLFLACLMCGSFFGSLREKREQGDTATLGFSKAADIASPYANDFVTATNVMMILIIAIYLIFIGVQFTYLFSAFVGMLPEGFIYSEYAVKGFYQLVFISIINGMVLLLSYLAKGGERYGKRAKTLRVLLVILTLLLLLTSASKLLMYISVYGFTMRRLESSFALMWLFTIFCHLLFPPKKYSFEKFTLTSAGFYFTAMSITISCLA